MIASEMAFISALVRRVRFMTLGALVVIENIIDNDRRQNAFGLLMSLNMLIETKEGYDFTGDDFDRWAKDSGFKKTSMISLTGPSSAAIAIK